MCSIHIKSLFEKKGFHKILPMSGLAETLLAIYNAEIRGATILSHLVGFFVRL